MNCTSLLDIIQKVMVRPKGSTKPWSSISVCIPTINRITGVCSSPWPSLLTTMLQMQQLEYLHSLPTKAMTLPSPSIQNMILFPPVHTSTSLTSTNSMRNSKMPSHFLRNSTNGLQIRIGFLCQTSKSVINLLSKQNSSEWPDLQRNYRRSI